MDAEIGIRDLADSFRYNVLPDIIDALGLYRDKLHSDVEVFEDLPEYEKLSMLARAQAELNYAVHWSFVQAKVNITDTLTASMKWCRYDDDFRERNGYRLPADPYWLAPPQGSIIPLWHRGGAPNYQPKPMISKHGQDPIKVWRREKQKGPAGAHILKSVAVVKEPTAIAAEKRTETGNMNQQTERFLRRNSLQLCRRTQKEVNESENEIEKGPTTQHSESLLLRNNLQLLQRTQEVQSPTNNNRFISIFFCSAGIIAVKLANKLHRWLSILIKDSSDLHLCSRSEPLNSLKASDLTTGNILLLVVSSSGQGEIPSNGLGLSKLCENMLSWRLMDRVQGFKFAVFGNGDSRYSATYNGAAIKINDHLMQVGGYPLAAGVFQADTAVDPLPFSALKFWLNKLQPSIVDQSIESLSTAVIRSPTDYKQAAVFVRLTPMVELGQKYEDYHDRLLSTLGSLSLVGARPGMHEGSMLVTFNVDRHHFEEMSCIQILPSNTPSKVNQALRSLCVKSSDHVDLGLDWKNPTYLSFLTDYVDLELPFSDVECLERIGLASQRGLPGAFLSRLSVHLVLERLQSSIVHMSDGQKCELCQNMPLLHTRTYSIASSRHYSSSYNRVSISTGREVDIMVKVLSGGRFSDTFMKDSVIPASLRYRIVDSPSGSILRKNHLRPFIVVATGAGFGPVRCLLQWRMGIIRNALATGHPLPRQGSGISLFLGFKQSDLKLMVDVLNEAMSLNLIDMLDIVLSNPMKLRVYDVLRRSPQYLRNKLLKQEGMAFVCTNKIAAEEVKNTIEKILGGRVGEMLGERYVEEAF